MSESTIENFSKEPDNLVHVTMDVASSNAQRFARNHPLLAVAGIPATLLAGPLFTTASMLTVDREEQERNCATGFGFTAGTLYGLIRGIADSATGKILS